MIAETDETAEKKKMMVKLHRQFGHPSSSSLKELLKGANILDKESSKIIDYIEMNCETCHKYKKTAPRPVVRMPMATRFNELLTVYLKNWGKGYIIHLIDMFSRFSRAKFISNKLPSTIIDCISTEWVALGFGPPGKILMDNGDEFYNEKSRSLGDNSISLLLLLLLTLHGVMVCVNGMLQCC